LTISDYGSYNGQILPTVAGRYYTLTVRYKSTGIHGDLHPKDSPLKISRYHNPNTSEYGAWDIANDNILLLDEVSPHYQDLYTGQCAPDSSSCNTDGDCPEGSTCVTNSNNWVTTSYTFLAQEDNEIIRVLMEYGECSDNEGNLNICSGGKGCRGICYDVDPDITQEMVGFYGFEPTSGTWASELTANWTFDSGDPTPYSESDLTEEVGFTGDFILRYIKSNEQGTQSSTHYTTELEPNTSYQVSFKYRSNNGLAFVVYDGGQAHETQNLEANQGGALTFNYEFTTGEDVSNTYKTLRFYVGYTYMEANTGDWIEIDDVSLKQVFSYGAFYSENGVTPTYVSETQCIDTLAGQYSTWVANTYTDYISDPTFVIDWLMLEEGQEFSGVYEKFDAPTFLGDCEIAAAGTPSNPRYWGNVISKNLSLGDRLGISSLPNLPDASDSGYYEFIMGWGNIVRKGMALDMYPGQLFDYIPIMFSKSAGDQITRIEIIFKDLHLPLLTYDRSESLGPLVLKPEEGGYSWNVTTRFSSLDDIAGYQNTGIPEPHNFSAYTKMILQPDGILNDDGTYTLEDGAIDMDNSTGGGFKDKVLINVPIKTSSDIFSFHKVKVYKDTVLEEADGDYPETYEGGDTYCYEDDCYNICMADEVYGISSGTYPEPIYSYDDGDIYQSTPINTKCAEECCRVYVTKTDLWTWNLLGKPYPFIHAEYSGIKGEIVVDETSSQIWLDGGYYPVLPKVNKIGKFDETKLDLQDNRIPFGTPGRNWDDDDIYAAITAPLSDQWLNYCLIDIGFTEVEDKSLEDVGPITNFGMLLDDFGVLYDDKKGPVELSESKPDIRTKLGTKDKGKSY